VSEHYGKIAFTEGVHDMQERYGTRDFYRRQAARATGDKGHDPLTDDAATFLSERDGFYLASISETGWPYVQFRGGPPGFLQVINAHTIGWADFRGNLQYISVGNLKSNDRVAMIAVDYPNRSRLKIFGHARVAFADEEPELVAKLAHPDYEAVVERAIVVSVDAYDWNCPQHITPRYTLDELEPRLAALRNRVNALETENATMRSLLATRD
jgi:predicted pyridoxine 5'-phosphate oxidase superfamily flavin-nucleotide-binding protein